MTIDYLIYRRNLCAAHPVCFLFRFRDRIDARLAAGCTNLRGRKPRQKSSRSMNSAKA